MIGRSRRRAVTRYLSARPMERERSMRQSSKVLFRTVRPDFMKCPWQSPSSRLWNNHFGGAELRWPARMEERNPAPQDSRARLAGWARRGRVRGFRIFEPRKLTFASCLSRMSRTSRTTVCGAGGLFVYPPRDGSARGSEPTLDAILHVVFGTEWWLGRAACLPIGRCWL